MEIKDTGNRTPMGDTGFVRDTHEGKGRMDLLPWDAIIALSKHSEKGALKYGERNVDLGAPQHSLIDSGMRHLAKYVDGETDEDHLLAAFWNIAWAVHQELKRPDMLDLPRHEKKSEPKEVYTLGEALGNCVETTCCYNNDFACTSNSGKQKPKWGADCPDYMED